MMKKIFTKESGRLKHIWFGFLSGLLFTVVGAALLGILTEYRDQKKGGKFDKYDFLATVVGGIIGTIVTSFFIYFFLQSGIWSVLFFIVANTAFVWGFGWYFEGFWWFPKAVYDVTIGLLKEKFK